MINHEWLLVDRWWEIKKWDFHTMMKQAKFEKWWCEAAQTGHVLHPLLRKVSPNFEDTLKSYHVRENKNKKKATLQPLLAYQPFRYPWVCFLHLVLPFPHPLDQKKGWKLFYYLKWNFKTSTSKFITVLLNLSSVAMFFLFKQPTVTLPWHQSN